MSDINLKESETRATFVENSQPKIGGDSTNVIRSALKKRNVMNMDISSTIVSSPLLSSTPSTISKSLVKIYPYLILADSFLGLVTWTNENIWGSILITLAYIMGILYFQNITKYFGHVVVVGLLWGYSLLHQNIEDIMSSQPTLDDIVLMMDKVTRKFDMFLSPITILSAQDIRRLLSTTIFLSPIYVVISLFIFPPRTLLLVGGVYILTYQSPWSKVTRRILWKFKAVRLFVFYLTGLDLGGINKNQGIIAAVHKQVRKLSSPTQTDVSQPGAMPNKTIRFTYVLYENQRRWIGIGWTSSMLSYERTPWTDEFLNQAPSPEDFTLPEESSDLTWKWVDKSWRLDLTNDGAIQLPSSKQRTTASPGADEGFIYYDNTWKKPSTSDSFSKYTRRRRWIRTAELIKIDTEANEDNEENSIEVNIQSIKDNEESKSAEQKDNDTGSLKRNRSVTILEEPIILGNDVTEENNNSTTVEVTETSETRKDNLRHRGDREEDDEEGIEGEQEEALGFKPSKNRSGSEPSGKDKKEI
ncbi:hypothetical protein Kpol_1025p30 [Vanderwaltozyma polyspora DSM 70294]|uniref:Peroxin/Ferlin domain-containing protein n=1 Tax=Vanderwaltozyma polyspora (strain ATCC 22028 / DSM 70294 / BCRC 21397 / CBS 2163 / NBRC 10782 / NRRL Y-8283 / UCD 57-17) TaxID=436907 RepID=A7TKV5_VANPO|nr:uncharacterized protein Kpol_1025p30 [Vanderwaltozyma polyspora DSM 70294]EDO17110.1 hypothetical protein Kpol_1025p30 [Vanderwaltozyma polyspora DSM 70294]